jgi:hypothetical protein
LAAFKNLSNTKADETGSMGLALLADIQQIFLESGQTSMFSKHLLPALWARSHRPWHPALRASPSALHWLGYQLRQFGVVSRALRIGQERAKGYELADLAGPFARFLKDEDSSSLSC